MSKRPLHKCSGHLPATPRTLLVFGVVAAMVFLVTAVGAEPAPAVPPDPAASVAAHQTSPQGALGAAPSSSASQSTPPSHAVADSGQQTSSPRLFVRDGQSCHDAFEVFVDQQLSEEMRPALEFLNMHGGGPAAHEQPTLLHVEAGQVRKVWRNGKETWVTGTVVVFELPYAVAWYYPATRVRPVLSWDGSRTSIGTSGGAASSGAVTRADRVKVVYDRDVYLGNYLGAFLWSVAAFLVLAAILGKCTSSLAKQIHSFRPCPALLLITGPAGFLSLSQAQVVLWTGVIGGTVLMFGLLRLEVPEVPPTLIALMGMSLLTGLVGKTKGLSVSTSGTVDSSEPHPSISPSRVAPDSTGGCSSDTVTAAESAAQQKPRRRARCSDLVSTWNDATNEPTLSLPKAQMVFWTVIVVALFVVKTALIGRLWEVPAELVALTGFSQLGYLGDKLYPSRGQPSPAPAR